MMKWAQYVVNWKKINVNKVCESVDMCRHLCTISLQEIERVAVDLFLTNEGDRLSSTYARNSNTIGVSIASMHNKYIHDMNSYDDRRKYMK